MKEKFLELPVALKKQILLRIGSAAICLLLFLTASATYYDLRLSLSFLLIGLILGTSGILLCVRLLDGHYVVVEGLCRRVERTALRRRLKAVYFSTDSQTIKVLLRHRLKRADAGDRITLYVADSTPVYEADNYTLVNGYLAMTIQKGVDKRESSCDD